MVIPSSRVASDALKRLKSLPFCWKAVYDLLLCGHHYGPHYGSITSVRLSTRLSAVQFGVILNASGFISDKCSVFEIALGSFLGAEMTFRVTEDHRKWRHGDKGKAKLKLAHLI